VTLLLQTYRPPQGLSGPGTIHLNAAAGMRDGTCACVMPGLDRASTAIRVCDRPLLSSQFPCGIGARVKPEHDDEYDGRQRRVYQVHLRRTIGFESLRRCRAGKGPEPTDKIP
jgi:hypothetical protein